MGVAGANIVGLVCVCVRVHMCASVLVYVCLLLGCVRLMLHAHVQVLHAKQKRKDNTCLTL